MQNGGGGSLAAEAGTTSCQGSVGKEGSPDYNPNYSCFYHLCRVFGSSLACNCKYCAPGLPGYRSLCTCAVATQPCGQDICLSEH